MFRTLTPIFSVVIAIAIFFFFTRPMFAEIKMIQDETDEYRQTVQNAVEFNRVLRELVSTRNSLSAPEVERLETLVPPSIDEVRILVDLERLALSHNLLFGNIQIAAEDEGGAKEGERATTLEELASSDISFSVIGTYDEFRAFLSDLESSLVRLEVVSLRFSVGESDLQQYELTVRTYALPPSQ